MIRPTLQINPYRPMSAHRLNADTRYWLLFCPGLVGPKTCDLTKRHRHVWSGASAAHTDWQTGTSGQTRAGGRGAVHFVASDRLQVPHSSTLASLSEMTLTAMFFHGTWSSDGNRPLITKSRSASLLEYSLIAQRSGGNVSLRFQVSPDGTGASAKTLTYSWTSFATNVPHWLVVSWDGTNATMYLAAQTDRYMTAVATSASMSIGGATFAGTTDVVVGAWGDGVAFHTGPVDDVRIAARAWSADEADEWYRSARTGHNDLLRPIRKTPPYLYR